MNLLGVFTDSLKEFIIPKSNYKPFPRLEEREKWNSLGDEHKQFFINQGEQFLNFKWPFLPAVGYMEFKINGNRSRFETLYFKRRYALGTLVMAECFDGNGRFFNDIINGIWAICEETSWSLPAHLPKFAALKLPFVGMEHIDLFAADTGSLLANISYLMENFFEENYPEVIERINHELQVRILDVYLKFDFKWMGLSGNEVNNWNPWINSNVLSVFLLTEENSEKRLKGISKILKSLDCFIDGYQDDGGCDEGPGYWVVAGGALYHALELLYNASNKKISIYDSEKIKNIARFIQKTHIHDSYFVNFADAAAKVDVPKMSIVKRAADLINDEELQNFANSILDFHGEYQISMWYELSRALFYLFHNHSTENKSEYKPKLDYWLNDIEVMTARENESTDKGLYIAAKGGNNDESHNHNDVGNFIVYLNGKPMIIDVGVESYTRKTFSNERYTIWTMQSAYHNLPTIGDEMQVAGKDYCATNVKYSLIGKSANLRMNISKAYPKSMEIKNWIRQITFNRQNEVYISINDMFSLKESTDKLFFTLMTYPEPEIKENLIELKSPEGEILTIEYNSNLQANIEEIKIEDVSLEKVWGNKIYRIIFSIKNSLKTGNFEMKIRSINV